MTKSIFNDDYIKKAVQCGIEKKFDIAEVSFEGKDSELTEEMIEIANKKKAERIFLYEMEKVETSDELAVVPVVVNGKVYTKGLFDYEDGYCDPLSLLIYVHQHGVELVRKSYSIIEGSSIVHAIDNEDKFMEDDAQIQ